MSMQFRHLTGLQVTVEETLEMIGIALFIHALLRYVGHIAPDLRLHVVAPAAAAEVSPSAAPNTALSPELS